MIMITFFVFGNQFTLTKDFEHILDCIIPTLVAFLCVSLTDCFYQFKIPLRTITIKIVRSTLACKSSGKDVKGLSLGLTTVIW